MCQVGRVSSLYLYPVKSLAGHEVGAVEVEGAGARAGGLTDRQLMVVDRCKVWKSSPITW